jgi:UTP--glucose-1-phosphate uridylyltransferase
MGRYVLTPQIFEYLGQHQVGAGGEIQLTDAIQMLNIAQGVYAYDFEGTRYDVGEKLGFILTSLEFALKNKELRHPLLTAMEEMLEKEHQRSLLVARGE